MKQIALSLLAPHEAYYIFHEILMLYKAHLEELGYEVLLRQNRLLKNQLNLVIGYHYLPPQAIAMLAGNYRYILIQLEQLGFDGGWFGQNKDSLPQLIPILKSAEQIWDYDQANIDFLKKFEVEAKLMPFGYHPSLEQFKPDAQPEFDVVFYGAINVPHHPSFRRQNVLEELDKHCKLHFIKNAYGLERDQMIKKAKLVVNIHGSDNLPIKEQARIFYLLTNQVLVVSEDSVWNPYGDDLACYPYEHLVEGVLTWLNKSPEEQQAMAQRGHECLKQIPFRDNMATYLSEIN